MKRQRSAHWLGFAAVALATVLLIGFAIAQFGTSDAERDFLRAIALTRGQSDAGAIAIAQWVTWAGDASQRTIAVVLLASLMLWQKRPRAALVMLVMPLLAGVMSSVLKEAFARPRPPLAWQLDVVNNLSYPSGHATNAAAALMLFALLWNGRRARIVTAICVAGLVAIGTSRMLLGVHWPSDVVGGWLLGFAFAFAGHAIAEQIEAKPHRRR